MKPFRHADDFAEWITANCHYCARFAADPENPPANPCPFPGALLKAQAGGEPIPDATMRAYTFDPPIDDQPGHWFAPARCPKRTDKRGRPSKAQPRTRSAKSQTDFL